MAENFGLKIGLEGEKEFKSSFSEINNSFKVLGSEMKLVESQFDKNDNSFQSLTARKKVTTTYHYTKFYKNMIFLLFLVYKNVKNSS